MGVQISDMKAVVLVGSFKDETGVKAEGNNLN